MVAAVAIKAGVESPPANTAEPLLEVVRYPIGQVPSLVVMALWQVEYAVHRAAAPDSQRIGMCLRDPNGVRHVYEFTIHCPEWAFLCVLEGHRGRLSA